MTTKTPTRAQAEEAVATLLRYILPPDEAEETLSGSGMRDTPSRVVKAWDEWTQGYRQDPVAILKKRFDDAGTYDGIVHVEGIRFCSTCEHHLAPIVGVADIAYMPGEGGAVVGLSKLPRVLNVFARRLQVQERLTNQIADVMEEQLRCAGVAVRIRAEHFCMTTRGVNLHGASTTTQELRGRFREPELHREINGLWGRA